MLSLQDCAQIAAKQLTELVPVSGQPLLEEAEWDGHYVLLTLGYYPLDKRQSAFVIVDRKEYKQFKIDAQDGGVVWMKIRKP